MMGSQRFERRSASGRIKGVGISEVRGRALKIGPLLPVFAVAFMPLLAATPFIKSASG